MSRRSGANYNGNYASVLAHSESATTVTNTVAETTLMSYTIPGGTLDVGDRLRVRGSMSWLNNDGSGRNFRFRLKLGATTMMDTGDRGFGPQAPTRVGWIDLGLAALGASSQRANGSIFIPTEDSTSTTWQRSFGSNAWLLVGNGVAAEDLSANKALVLTVEMNSTATTNVATTLHDYTIQRIPA